MKVAKYGLILGLMITGVGCDLGGYTNDPNYAANQAALSTDTSASTNTTAGGAAFPGSAVVSAITGDISNPPTLAAQYAMSTSGYLMLMATTDTAVTADMFDASKNTCSTTGTDTAPSTCQDGAVSISAMLCEKATTGLCTALATTGKDKTFDLAAGAAKTPLMSLSFQVCSGGVYQTFSKPVMPADTAGTITVSSTGTADGSTIHLSLKNFKITDATDSLSAVVTAEFKDVQVYTSPCN